MKWIVAVLALALLAAGMAAYGDQPLTTDRSSYVIYRNVVVDTVVARVWDQLKVKHELGSRWQEEPDG